LLVLFLVGKNPDITRTEVRNFFRDHNLPSDGVDRRLRELESRSLIKRQKTPAGTRLNLSKDGKIAHEWLSDAFQNALLDLAMLK
jgi:predicted HTH transcriptional regulator